MDKKKRVAWNKGLTSETDWRVKKNTENGRKTQKGKHNSPRTEWKKGNPPWNKGKKVKYYSRPNRKGQEPWNYIDGRSKIKGPDRYGDDWSKIRQLVYYRDNFTCQKCDKKMDKNNILHVHHIIPFLETFDNSLNNLITLCASCHRKEDTKIIKERKYRRKFF